MVVNSIGNYLLYADKQQQYKKAKIKANDFDEILQAEIERRKDGEKINGRNPNTRDTFRSERDSRQAKEIQANYRVLARSGRDRIDSQGMRRADEVERLFAD